MRIRRSIAAIVGGGAVLSFLLPQLTVGSAAAAETRQVVSGGALHAMDDTRPEVIAGDPAESGDGIPEGEDAQIEAPVEENVSDVAGNVTGADVAPENTPTFLTEEDRVGFIEAVNDWYVTGEATKAEAEGLLQENGIQADALTQKSIASAGVAPTAIPASRTLTITQRPQVLGYYCGPATAQMILSRSSLYESRWDSSTRSQSALGRSQYLRTTASAGTPWREGRMSSTLNKWVHGFTDTRGQNRKFLKNTRPSLATYKRLYRESIGDAGYATAVGTVERAGSFHYNNHPRNRLIGHWIAGYGYTSTSTKYADSSNQMWGGHGRFSATTSTFTARYITSGNGVVYALDQT